MSLIVDGVTYAIPVIEITRSADFLYKYADRTEDGHLHSEMIGCYFNYKIKLGSTTDTSLYASLWAKLTEADESHSVTVPDEDGVTYTFDAYFAKVSDKLRKIKGSTSYWQDLSVDFIAMVPAIT